MFSFSQITNATYNFSTEAKLGEGGFGPVYKGNLPEGQEVAVKRLAPNSGQGGYMAPEYAMVGIFSVKSDVYSYGVLLLEIVSGMKNAGSQRRGNSLSLLGYAWELWNEGRCQELIDKPLHGRCPENVALRCIHVSLLCVQEQAADRPSMTEVLSMITNENATVPDPKQPGFLSMLVSNQAEITEETCSLNGLSITNLDGR
ncbi:unnamed protein product [Urochloa decumbens]|uniref:Protein kinase domain-containing protein n=1 Tax=Urochloa decumbens TaxID=240449 RepID=A0ABC8ZJ59_9POAL